ncbi:hypothetical protein AL515_22980 [Citrobacter sp. FDAARGOS_156]|nr:hypothetical protein AL515_22980 [Citrobacter sp. FDAARGOS_156]
MPLYPSYFKLQVRWLCSRTPVTYLSKLLAIRCVAAFLQRELFRVYLSLSKEVFIVRRKRHCRATLIAPRLAINA